MTWRPDFPELAWLAGFCCYQLNQLDKALTWELLAIQLGHLEGWQMGKNRLSFRHIPSWYEGPYDVLHWTYLKLGDVAAAQQARQKYQQAMTLREKQA